LFLSTKQLYDLDEMSLFHHLSERDTFLLHDQEKDVIFSYDPDNNLRSIDCKTRSISDEGNCVENMNIEEHLTMKIKENGYIILNNKVVRYVNGKVLFTIYTGSESPTNLYVDEDNSQLILTDCDRLFFVPIDLYPTPTTTIIVDRFFNDQQSSFIVE
jgi:hypothetical protein